MAEPLRKSFNTKAYRKAIAVSTIALSAAITPQVLTATPRAEHTTQAQDAFHAFVQNFQTPPDHRENEAKILAPLSVIEMWQNYGAPEEALTALAKMPPDTQEKLGTRTAELFKTQDFKEVLIHMAAGKPKKMEDMLESIANMPASMELVTVPYVRVSKEQNDAVWAEFQAKSEPAFYRHLAANHAEALKAAGFCDYGISCFARGLAPTTAEGLPYNVDVDHLVERAGGGTLSTEKSVDPVTGGEPTFQINHVSNLCLIMRDIHKLKNDLNGIQNIGATEPGETRMLCMAIPPAENRPVSLHAHMLQSKLPNSLRDAIYFTNGPSTTLINDMQQIAQETNITPDAGAELFDVAFSRHFSHTINIWQKVATHLEGMAQETPFKKADATSISQTCENFLNPLIKACESVHVPAQELEKLHKISDRMDNLVAAVNAPQTPPPAATQKQGTKAKLEHNGPA